MLEMPNIIRFLQNKPLKIRIIVFVFIVLLIVKCSGSGSDEKLADNIATYKVKRGPLNISVIESGTISARDQVIIKSEVEGRTSILWLIDEGVEVKKGDLLVELDSSDLVDYKIDQEIRVQNAEASFIRAREGLAVAENQAKSDVDKAELTFEFAKQDLTKYLEGEYPNLLKEQQSRIILAEEELQRAQEKLKWSETLHDEDYLSTTELQADQLAANRKRLDLELAKSDLELLENFTYKRKVAELQSDVKQTEMALERTKRKATADIIQAQADLRAKDSEYNRQKNKLEKMLVQIVKTMIYAPSDGQVIYATSAQGRRWRGNDEPLDEGQEVRERQELIYLPTTSSVKADVDIHESSMEKIYKGLPVKITVDALLGKVFTGRVARISPLPDPTSAWLNPDLKVYGTEIHLDNNDEALRTGLSCKAEIIIEKYDDALYVPIQAVLRVKGNPTVYVVKGSKQKPREVEIGMDNNRMIHIKSGLEAGEVVMLTPPLSAGTVDQAELVEEDAQDEPQHPLDRTPPAAGRERQGGGRRKGKGREKKQQPAMGRMGNMTPEQMKKMREQYEKMSPEEKKKQMEKFQKMSQQGNPKGQKGDGKN